MGGGGGGEVESGGMMEARKRRESKRWEGGMGAEGRKENGGRSTEEERS